MIVRLPHPRRLTTEQTFQCLAVVVGTFGIIRGLAYSPIFSPERLPMGVEVATKFVPIWVWSGLWVLAGIAAYIGAWFTKPPAGAGVAGMCGAWAVSFTVSWVLNLQFEFPGWLPWGWSIRLIDPTVRDYLNASVYWTICLMCVFGRYLAADAMECSEPEAVAS